ncbi:S9 family peptidase [Alteromonas sp. ASW11-130]|uniref:S9 family peptidase n=1 Tax=Alteromonas sp. ASW11-130 TaxID=3015775 RepID=UPI002242A86D|nr:alpha/beta fold hydrolase [Alteromonas sp. ASW11-130]MCW8093198.1 alpha/beta fold hydrolase [Alteromonas sp. ASW11-130]
MKIKTTLVTLLFVPFFSHAVEERVVNNGNLVLQNIPEISEQVVSDLNQYQNIRSAPFETFSKDGESIFITTRFGEVSQLHRVDMPKGARHQITFFKEPIGSVVRQPGTDKIAFTMDAGGSEYSQIFLLDPNTGKSSMLTDGKSRNSALEWSESGKWLAYQSTERNGSANDIWIMNPQSPDKRRVVLESQDGSWWGPIDWNDKDTKILAQQYISASDSRIFLLDVESGEQTLIDGSEQSPSVNYAWAFGKDNNGYFLSTNQKSEFTQLAYRDITKDTLEIITDKINWDVQGFAISHNGERAAFTTNEDGISKLYLLDTKNFRYEPVSSIPVGLVGSIEFSPDDSKLAMTLNTAQTPSDTFVLDLKRQPTSYGKLTRWTFSEVGGLNTDNFVLPELVRYPTFDDRQIPAFVYKPEADGPRPVIISIHGGPEGQSRPSFASTYQLWMDTLGAAVVVPNVRGSSGYGKEYINLDNGFNREDSVKDIGALLDWIATQPDLDENRVAVFGGSYGGYMVLASAVHYSDRLSAAVDIVGISNFVTFLKNTKDYRRDLRRVEYGDERDQKMHDFLQKISPSNSVDKIDVPMFVIQGENDPRVPVSEAEQIVKALRDEGKEVWYMNALNEGHGYRKKENRDVYQQAVVMFFEEYLVKPKQ